MRMSSTSRSTCQSSLEMSPSFFSFLGNKTSGRSCGNCGKLGAAFLRRVFQAPVGKWENMQFVFPLFHRRGSFHSFPRLATVSLSQNHLVASCFISGPLLRFAL